MQDVKVKVCGVTDLDNARGIAELGVDYMGFIVNYPASSRFVRAEVVRKIVADLRPDYPEMKFVGVVVDADREEIVDLVDECGFDVVQLLGNETVEVCTELSHEDFEVWKAVIVANKTDLARMGQFRGCVDKILVDSGRGGGKALDFDTLNGADFDILAGGLGPDNVAEAVDVLSPEIVDLNSGVEASPGMKDLGLVSECLDLFVG